ncbi:unnamed protein product [Rangifer tarandus platyrhynchus]|uniref:Uncharacterized protein n=2 Tax=Rangifer tarandus platyrhynchus TaxID=3082113 RepID=A0ABN8XQG4_RANTA|nr:unnamed protein product [Rangifer tarandus platyrhynchus]CAI9691114.1 unnamed protein product [Rangifer tarandus platyrhynchus]
MFAAPRGAEIYTSSPSARAALGFEVPRLRVGAGEVGFPLPVVRGFNIPVTSSVQLRLGGMEAVGESSGRHPRKAAGGREASHAQLSCLDTPGRTQLSLAENTLKPE